ncbi:MAG: hypothetical protein KC518_09990 [Candidatus Cloacimonetes bacterium]|nr:hypothetical protein [Candidatus Cloacimonadota bacterium]
MTMPRVDPDLLPPFALPARFFLTAPLFGMLCAGWLLVSGPGIWVSRWHPALLGATHLLVLGFLLMVMVGALAQVVPVIAMRSLPAARTLLPWVHILLCLGTLLLAASLGLPRPLWLPWALASLLPALSVFAGMLLWALLGKSSGEIAASLTRLSGLALVVTILLGAWLALGTRWPGRFAIGRWLTDVHASWGLLGAAGLLVIAVGSQVIPMFHVTPAFPKAGLRAMAAWLLAGLLLALLGVSRTGGNHGLWAVTPWVSLAGVVLFAVLVQLLLAKRKRKVPDATVNAWRLAAGGLLLGAVILPLSVFTPQWGWPAGSTLAAQFLLLGSLWTIVVGMLLKIVPFLAWLHLQSLAGFQPSALARVPHMQALLAGSWARAQVALHAVAMVTLVICPLWSDLHVFACLLLLGNMALLGGLLGLAVLRAGKARSHVVHALAEARGQTSGVFGRTM